MDNLQKYQYVVWDWNGTLIDDVDYSIRTINEILQRRCMNIIDVAYYREIFGFPIKDYYTRLGFTYENETFEDVANEFMQKYNRNSGTCKLYDGVEGVLRKISERNMNQSILSAMPEAELSISVKENQIHGYFDQIIGLSDNYAASKVETGKAFMNERCLNSREVLLIGDTIHDYEVACELGCDCILVSKGHQSSSRLKKLDIVVIDSVMDLL